MDIEDFVPFVDDIIILRCFSSALKRWPFFSPLTETVKTVNKLRWFACRERRRVILQFMFMER